VALLVANDLTKAFGPQTILAGASLAIEEDERVGLVGVNGSGKSTLAKILVGLEIADGGTVARRRDAPIAYLPQEPVFPSEERARDVVRGGLAAWTAAKARHDAASAALSRGEGDAVSLLARQAEASAEIERLGGWDPEHRVESLLGHLGLAARADAPFGRLSGGERRRVALARILVAQPALAVLDEPTNHLDVDTVEWLETYLIESYAGALLMITHDRYVLDRVCTRTLEVDAGRVYSYDGGYESYLAAKAERAAQAERTEKNRQNLLRRELEWLRRTPSARTGKQKARISRAQTAIAAPRPTEEKRVALELETRRTGKTILALEDVLLRAPGEGGRTLAEGVTLQLVQGERLGIVGPNGAGKTTLLRTLLGEIAAASGAVTIGKNTDFAYFDQGRSGLDDARSIADNITGGAPRVTVNGQTMHGSAYMERFLFDPSKQRQPVGALSGGERARVALAKLLLRPANLLVLDEPTNDLDLATLSSLEELLVETEATALVVTHDRWFLDRVATGILAFEPDAAGRPRVVKYPGGHGTYLALKAEAEARRLAEQAERTATERTRSAGGERASQAPDAARAQAPAEKRGKRALTYGERLELDALPAKIEAHDAQLATLDARVADPATYTDGTDVAALVRQLEAARAESTRLLARWEELELKREAGES
jgi:ATP-binding cassette subfamily F protein uup